MDIGQPKRIIEIVPATLPVPGELEPVAPGTQPEVEPDVQPERVPGEPEPAERPV
jgi:hypothetical protein